MEARPDVRHFSYYATLCLSLTLAACGGGSGGSGDNTSQSEERIGNRVEAVQTDAEDATRILESVYLDHRTPDGFYRESEPEPGVFQTVTHIKNIDIMDPDDITAATARFELCSDDFTQALEWSRAAADGLGQLVDNRQNDLFFEFTRTPLDSPHLSNLQRVYKCSILDRSTVDLNHPDNHRGLYTELPPSADHIRLLVEYFWTFGPFNNYGNAVLNSTTREETSHHLHTLRQARLSEATGRDDSCDRIDVYNTHYRVDKLTGSITVTEVLEQTLYARYRDGQIELCGS